MLRLVVVEDRRVMVLEGELVCKGRGGDELLQLQKPTRTPVVVALHRDQVLA